MSVSVFLIPLPLGEGQGEGAKPSKKEKQEWGWFLCSLIPHPNPLQRERAFGRQRRDVGYRQFFDALITD